MPEETTSARLARSRRSLIKSTPATAYINPTMGSAELVAWSKKALEKAYTATNRTLTSVSSRMLLINKPQQRHGSGRRETVHALADSHVPGRSGFGQSQQPG